MSLLLGLPDECLVHVMRQLDGEPRSQLAAARACARLRRTAAATLNSVVVGSLDAARRDSVQRYLGQHGRHVTSISISGGAQLELALPPSCTRLRALSLSLVRLHLGGHQGVLQTATGLTRLALEYCDVLDGAGSTAAALGALSGLRELVCRSSALPGGAALPGCWLSSLVQLTRLHMLDSRSVQDDTLQHLGCLTNLLALDVQAARVTDAAFTGLEELQQLTGLELADLRLCDVGSGSTAAISRLTALQRLFVQECGGFEPACLAGVSQLQSLQLVDTPVAGGPDGVAVFLAQLAGLQQLRELRVVRAFEECAPAVAAYSALTASSQLTCLELCSCTLPEGVWQHVFERTRLLPNLLVLNAAEGGEDEDTVYFMTTDQVYSMATCCPRLRELNLSVQPSDQVLAMLLRLSALTQLHVSGATDAAVLAAPLCQLTGLEDLWLDGDNGRMRTGATLLHLTALQQLTQLTVSLASPEAEDDEDAPHLTLFEIETRAGQPPDVAAQLLQHCLENHAPCQVPLSLLARQAQQLACQEQQLQEQAVKVAAQAAETAELRSRLARLEQLLLRR